MHASNAGRCAGAHSTLLAAVVIIGADNLSARGQKAPSIMVMIFIIIPPS